MKQKEIKARISADLHQRIGHALVERDATMSNAIIEAYREECRKAGVRAEGFYERAIAALIVQAIRQPSCPLITNSGASSGRALAHAG